MAEYVKNIKFDLKQLLNKNRNDYDYLIKTVKGFAFDSLIFRFKNYQARALQSEVNDYKYKHNTLEEEARQCVKDMHDRDLMRFVQILDSVIGEHN